MELYFLTFTEKFPVEQAIKIFEKKYGAKPERVFVEKHYLKVGPEPRRSVINEKSATVRVIDLDS
jgi:hypothetical protein